MDDGHTVGMTGRTQTWAGATTPLQSAGEDEQGFEEDGESTWNHRQGAFHFQMQVGTGAGILCHRLP